jgi:prefoldin subunit 5
MTPEEMQRTMEFLLAQQARFDTRLEKLFESHERLERSVMELRESVEGLRESFGELRESHVTLTSSMLRVVGLVEGLAKAQKATDERLNVLINVVEKHITGPDHGRRAPRK